MKFRKMKTLLLVLPFALALTGCAGSSNAPTDSESSAEKETKKDTYTVEVLSDAISKDSSSVLNGLKASLESRIDSDSREVKLHYDTGKTSDKDLKSILKRKPNLIVANGERSLEAAAKATEKIPIVAVNVMNYQKIVGLSATGVKDWDQLTGRNVTGISSAPNVSATLSLIIEATPKLEQVGILYSTYDDNAIFQDTRLEEYLDEAGIKWKEYDVPLQGQTVTAAPTPTPSATPSPESDSTSVPSPTLPAAAPATLTADQVVNKAVSENSVLFLSRGSLLSDQIQMIATAAEKAGKGLVASDEICGKYALATIYSDPYQEGVRAGSIVSSILVDRKKANKLKVQEISFDAEHKLYNTTYADQLKITFPKSFTEFQTYFNSLEATEGAS